MKRTRSRGRPGSGTSAPCSRSLAAQISAWRRSLPAIVRNAPRPTLVLLDRGERVVQDDRVALELQVLEALVDVADGHGPGSFEAVGSPESYRRVVSREPRPMARRHIRTCRRVRRAAAPPLPLGATTSRPCMPPLDERLALAERTMRALVADAELPPKIGVHPAAAGLVRARDAGLPAWRPGESGRRLGRPAGHEVGVRLPRRTPRGPADHQRARGPQRPDDRAADRDPRRRADHRPADRRRQRRRDRALRPAGGRAAAGRDHRRRHAGAQPPAGPRPRRAGRRARRLRPTPRTGRRHRREARATPGIGAPSSPRAPARRSRAPTS